MKAIQTATKKTPKTTLWGDVRHPAKDFAVLSAQAGESEPVTHDHAKRWLAAYVEAAHPGGIYRPVLERIADRMDDGDREVWFLLDFLFDAISRSAKAGALNPEEARALRPVFEDMVRAEWGPDSKWARAL